MSCLDNVIIQTFVLQAPLGSPPPFPFVFLAKCQGGEMEVLEIALQLITATPATIQFYEGLPAQNSLGKPLSLQIAMQQYQLLSIPGKVVYDDIYASIPQGGSFNVMVRIRQRTGGGARPASAVGGSFLS